MRDARKVVAALFALALLAGSGPAAAKIVCWTDDKGRRACGDKVPPQYAKKERKLYDSRGRVIDTQERERTREEVEAEQRQLREAQAAEAKAAEQERYDRFLIQNYETIDDLIRARDDRLAMIDARLSLAEKNQREYGARVEQLERNAGPLREAGKPLPDKLASQLANFTRSRDDAAESVRNLTEERGRVAADFNRDIARYRLVKAEAARK